MLVLQRQTNEQIVIPTPLGPIRITVCRIDTKYGKAVRLGFEAPRQINIVRAEVFDAEQTPEVCEGVWGSMPIGDEPAGAA